MKLNLDKSSWTKISFGEVAIKQKGKVDRENTRLTKYVKGEHLNSEDLHIRSHGTLTDEYLGPAFTRSFEVGDILYGSRRTYLRKVAVAHFNGITSNTTFVIKANPKLIEPRLLPFIMLSEGFAQHSIRNSKGSVNPYINWKDIANYQFLLPPKAEQARLAELLWAGDGVLEGYRRVLFRSKRVFDSLNQDYFASEVMALTDLHEVADVVMGQSPPGKSYNDNGEGIPLLNGPTEFTDRYPVKVQWTTSAKKLCKTDDILLCVRGSTTGRINIADDTYCIGRGIAAIRGKNNIETSLLEFILRYNVTEILKRATGSTFPNITSTALKTIKVPVFASKQRAKIINELSSFDRLNFEGAEAKVAVKSLQKSLINQIF